MLLPRLPTFWSRRAPFPPVLEQTLSVCVTGPPKLGSSLGGQATLRLSSTERGGGGQRPALLPELNLKTLFWLVFPLALGACLVISKPEKQAPFQTCQAPTAPTHRRVSRELSSRCTQKTLMFQPIPKCLRFLV